MASRHSEGRRPHGGRHYRLGDRLWLDPEEASHVTRARLSRAVAISATAVLLVMAVSAGTVSGANSRDLVIGSAPLIAPDFANSGKLLPTPVTQGGTTMFTVEVLSNDNQTIAHSQLSISIATSPAGLTLSQFYDPDGGTDASTCSASGNVISCDFGNLPAFAERTIAVVVDVSATFPTNATGLFSATSTTNNENGSNLQLFTATSDPFTVQPASANGLTTFTPPGQKKKLETSALGTTGAGRLQSTVEFTADGDGDTVALSDGTNPTGKYACPTGLTCQPDYSEVLFSRSDFGNPYLKWSLKALVPGTYALSKGFLVHYTSAGTADPVMFFKDRTVYCGSDVAGKLASSGQCLQLVTLSKVDKATGLATLTIEAYFDHNGGSRF
jgi:hypothetical protein